MTDPGWYQAEGDPAGTVRWWDGAQWVGGPTNPGGAGVTGASATASGGIAAMSPMGAASGPGVRASAGRRIAARLIDSVLGIIVLIVFVAPELGEVFDNIADLPTDPTDDEFEAAISDPFDDVSGRFAILPFLAYAVEVAFVKFLGGTPGKLMMGIRVAERDTAVTPPSWKHAALRSLNRLLGVVGLIAAGLAGAASGIGALIGLASLIMLFANNERRTVMDLVAGTVVNNK